MHSFFLSFCVMFNIILCSISCSRTSNAQNKSIMYLFYYENLQWEFITMIEWWYWGRVRDIIKPCARYTCGVVRPMLVFNRYCTTTTHMLDNHVQFVRALTINHETSNRLPLSCLKHPQLYLETIICGVPWTTQTKIVPIVVI